MNAQRYHVMTHTPPIERVADSEGLYVLHSDYSSLQAKHDRLVKALESIASCPEEDISDQTVYVMLGIARSALLADEVTDER